MNYYLLLTHMDVQSEITGPYRTQQERDVEARAVRSREGNETGIFQLDVSDSGVPRTYDYPGKFFDTEVCWGCGRECDYDFLFTCLQCGHVFCACCLAIKNGPECFCSQECCDEYQAFWSPEVQKDDN